MPCRDYEDSGPVYVDRPETVQMLCTALRALESSGQPIPKNCAVWWTAHKREDVLRVEAETKRLAREAKRKAILAGLSAEDKKILGL